MATRSAWPRLRIDSARVGRLIRPRVITGMESDFLISRRWGRDSPARSSSGVSEGPCGPGSGLRSSSPHRARGNGDPVKACLLSEPGDLGHLPVRSPPSIYSSPLILIVRGKAFPRRPLIPRMISKRNRARPEGPRRIRPPGDWSGARRSRDQVAMGAMDIDAVKSCLPDASAARHGSRRDFDLMPGQGPGCLGSRVGGKGRRRHRLKAGHLRRRPGPGMVDLEKDLDAVREPDEPHR